MDSDLPEEQKIALVITFSQIIRKALSENPSPEIKLDLKIAYLPFLDITQGPIKGKFGRENVFIRAYGNVPNQKSWRSFKSLLKMYEDDPQMKVYIIGCMDKLADEYPLTTFRTLKELLDSDPATSAAAVIQMMRTRQVSTEMLTQFLSDTETGVVALREAVQQIVAACVYSNAFGTEM